MKTIGLISCAIILLALPALAAVDETESGKGASGLPLPRFASLRSNEVNMRTGPGTRYPIDWVFRQQGLPVEITAEYDIWRRVRDPEGAEGWVHKSALSGKRMAVVSSAHDLHAESNEQAPVTAHLDKGALGQVMSCTKDWCKMKFEDVKGYLPKADFWGVYPSETFD